jgi:hypothetical protein
VVYAAYATRSQDVLSQSLLRLPLVIQNETMPLKEVNVKQCNVRAIYYETHRVMLACASAATIIISTIPAFKMRKFIVP